MTSSWDISFFFFFPYKIRICIQNKWGHGFVSHKYNLVSSQNTKKNNMSLRVEALRMDIRFTSDGWMDGWMDE
jgi:hypothetical protein